MLECTYCAFTGKHLALGILTTCIFCGSTIERFEGKLPPDELPHSEQNTYLLERQVMAMNNSTFTASGASGALQQSPDGRMKFIIPPDFDGFE